MRSNVISSNKLKADRHAAQVASETLQQIEPRPFADRDQGGREQRPERNAHAWTDQPLLDRVAHQKDAAERERDAANPNHPAGAEPFLKPIDCGGEGDAALTGGTDGGGGSGGGS